MNKLNYLIYITIIIVLFFFINGNTEITQQQTNEALKPTEQSLFNITNTIKYTNLYEEEMTINNVIYNIIHPIIYTIVVQINTIIPVAIDIIYNGLTKTTISIIVTLLFLLLIPKIIMTTVVFYFFIKERKQYKEKIHE